MRETVAMKALSSRKQGENPPRAEQRSEAERAGDLRRLRCLNYGQNIFVNAGDEAPEVCQYCNDMTTWQALDG
ncbi:MAG: hypothetical protein OXN88_05855 [Chloroflexota bacterium]|nr:hypothetical protein [Chloroflexota bacterium]